MIATLTKHIDNCRCLEEALRVTLAPTVLTLIRSRGATDPCVDRRGHNEAMDVELLTIPGCPHAVPARELFASALELEGIDPALLAVTEITTDADAAAASFQGSPSFIIDGKDLFPSDAAPALTCRVYPSQRGLSGQPDLESLREAIRGVRPRGRLRT